MDVNVTFLHIELKEEVLIEELFEFVKLGKAEMTRWLMKGFYVLRLAP